MTSLPIVGPPLVGSELSSTRFTVALVGSPNAGKTSLFNLLTGMKSQTANFSGTTVERKRGVTMLDGVAVEVIDLPGVYSLGSATAEEKVALDVISGDVRGTPRPNLLLVVADASNMERSLFLLSQFMETGVPVIVVVNMIDQAERHGLHVNAEALSEELGCPVIPMVARSGKGFDVLRKALGEVARPESSLPSCSSDLGDCGSCGGCPFAERYTWSDSLTSKVVSSCPVARGSRTEGIDKVLTHSVVGLAALFAILLTVFYLIFSVASVPMDLIDGLFAGLGGVVGSWLPEGDFRSLLVDGVIGGVGGILVFLPQICILFFFLALLEDSGYLSRGAFVMDRLMRRIGLPGTAFVPLLSAHACAIPAIMATRVIRDPRDRLVTILVAPLMSCSARIPVYAMVIALLFPDSPGKAALLFSGSYSLGIVGALLVSFVLKRTILPGESKPLVLELPPYRVPCLKTAFFYTFDRAKVFVSQAGTIILAISVILWALATYPKSDVAPEALVLQEQALVLEAAGEGGEADVLLREADVLDGRYALSHSFAGQLGKLIEPVVRPLGFDWQMGIGIITSFAAREVIVSTLAIVYGVGADAVEENPVGLYDTLKRARHDDGRPVFTPASSVSLLVFYIFAMQCLPTQAITRRETNTWKWPIFQFVYMTLLAYFAALGAYHLMGMFT